MIWTCIASYYCYKNARYCTLTHQNIYDDLVGVTAAEAEAEDDAEAEAEAADAPVAPTS